MNSNWTEIQKDVKKMKRSNKRLHIDVAGLKAQAVLDRELIASLRQTAVDVADVDHPRGPK